MNAFRQGILHFDVLQSVDIKRWRSHESGVRGRLGLELVLLLGISWWHVCLIRILITVRSLDVWSKISHVYMTNADPPLKPVKDALRRFF